MKQWLNCTLARILLAFFLAMGVLLSPAQAMAKGEVLGIHILNPSELNDAEELLKSTTEQEEWHYLTVPLSLEDTKNVEQWQGFFKAAKEKKLIPIVRLVTKFENGAWTVPSKREVVQMVSFLNQLEWPTEEKWVIVFNEPNHAKEWGGQVNPEEYAQVLRFTADWLHTEQKGYRVLPAGLDLAAPNGRVTMEAFTYLERMLAVDPEIFTTVDAWNSHSYPNPGFSSSPQRVGQNSLRGFQYELAYLKEKTGREYQVFITETGWEENAATSRWLPSYYQYAYQHIWSDSRVIAVTPFILRGAPGPFARFSFLDSHGRPTRQYTAYQNILGNS
jgi:hypothetical protein